MGSAWSLPDRILFPAPHSSYDERLPGLLWLPGDALYTRTAVNSPLMRPRDSFPAVFIESRQPVERTFLYWHGNSCDLGQLYEELWHIADRCKANVLAIEYPGYGLSGTPVSPLLINTWSLRAVDFLTKTLGVRSQAIYCFGRSIGTGPAAFTALAMATEGLALGGLILQSPYTSVHGIIAEFWRPGQWLVSNYWDNGDALQKLADHRVALLVIHGLEDEIIPVSHGQWLLSNYPCENKMGAFSPHASHNVYYVVEDVANPIREFVAAFEDPLPNWTQGALRIPIEYLPIARQRSRRSLPPSSKASSVTYRTSFAPSSARTAAPRIGSTNELPLGSLTPRSAISDHRPDSGR